MLKYNNIFGYAQKNMGIIPGSLIILVDIVFLLKQVQCESSAYTKNTDISEGKYFKEILLGTLKKPNETIENNKLFTIHELPFSTEAINTDGVLFNHLNRRRRHDNDDDGAKKGKKGEDHSGETDGDSNLSTTDLYIQGDLDAKEIDYEEAAEEAEIIRNMMFNNPERQAWTTTYINHSVVEEKCEQSNPCLASERVSPVCGSDWGSYLNPGVFRCAQKCEKGLTVFNMGPCPGYVMPPMPPATTVPPPTTPEPEHETPDSRLRIRGIFVQPLFRLLGLHVHEDGGFYLSNEKKNHTWWNI